MSSIPIIRLEVENMRHNIVMALNEKRAELDEYVQIAVNRATNPKNVQAVVEKAVYSAMDEAIKEEVNAFFRYNGDGRKMIAEQVKKKLLSKESFTPLDDV